MAPKAQHLQPVIRYNLVGVAVDVVYLVAVAAAMLARVAIPQQHAFALHPPALAARVHRSAALPLGRPFAAGVELRRGSAVRPMRWRLVRHQRMARM